MWPLLNQSKKPPAPGRQMCWRAASSSNQLHYPECFSFTHAGASSRYVEGGYGCWSSLRADRTTKATAQTAETPCLQPGGGRRC